MKKDELTENAFRRNSIETRKTLMEKTMKIPMF
jgi:hypothetical protein